MTDLEAQAEALAQQVVQDVAELPDRTSPDDWPEAMLVTSEELRSIVSAALRRVQAETWEAAAKEVHASIGVRFAYEVVDRLRARAVQSPEAK